MFELHERLDNDCFLIGDFSLCRLLMMNDSQYPWFILVPRVEGITEIFQLSQAEQNQLAIESSVLSKALSIMFEADKMNVAALGNVVSQLHVHHVVRFKHDAVWPAPIWGQKTPILYTSEAALSVIERFHSLFSIEFEYLVTKK